MMQGGNTVIGCAVEEIGRSGNDYFAIPAHETIYTEIVADWLKGAEFDEIIFTQRLRDEKKLDPLGGNAKINTLRWFVPSAANLQNFLEILRDKRWLRLAHRLGEKIAQASLEQQHEVEGIKREVERALFELSRDSGEQRRQRSIKEIVRDVLANIDEPEKVLGISTGFPKLDAVVGGLAPGAKIVLAGKISGGKSAFAECLADSLAVTRKVPVAIFTFEMSAEQTVQRIIQIRAEVSTRSVVTGESGMFGVSEYSQAAAEVAASPLHVISSRIDVAGIRSWCLRLQPRVAIIDYLQIIPERKQQGENRTDQLDRMSGETKQLAHSTGMTIIELSQLTMDKDGTVKTRGSHGITADSDQLWIIEGEDDEEKQVIEKNLTIAKQRDGERRSIPFHFVRAITKFRQKN